MPKHMGINRAYVAGDIEKSPAEKQVELDAKMKEFLAKGGVIQQVPTGKSGQLPGEETNVWGRKIKKAEVPTIKPEAE